MSTPFNPVADLTDQQRAGGGGMDMRVLWMCGHRASSTGARYRKVPGRQPLPWMCPACNAARLAAKEAA